MIKLRVIVSTLPLFLLAFTTACSHSSDGTQTPSAQSRVLKAEEERDGALVQTDLAALDRLYAPEYIAVGNTGRVRTKAQVLAAFREKPLNYESRDTRDVIVQVYGDAAVVTGLLLAKSKDGRSAERRFVNVWVKRSKRWQLVVHQSTPVVAAQ